MWLIRSTSSGQVFVGFCWFVHERPDVKSVYGRLDLRFVFYLDGIVGKMLWWNLVFERLCYEGRGKKDEGGWTKGSSR